MYCLDRYCNDVMYVIYKYYLTWFRISQGLEFPWIICHSKLKTKIRICFCSTISFHWFNFPTRISRKQFFISYLRIQYRSKMDKCYYDDLPHITKAGKVSYNAETYVGNWYEETVRNTVRSVGLLLDTKRKLFFMSLLCFHTVKTGWIFHEKAMWGPFYSTDSNYGRSASQTCKPICILWKLKLKNPIRINAIVNYFRWHYRRVQIRTCITVTKFR